MFTIKNRGHCDRMVVGFTTTCAINAYHHKRCEFEPCSWQGLLDTTLCDKVCQWLATGLWFSLGSPVSSTNKTDHHDINEILLKVALTTINQTTNKKSYITLPKKLYLSMTSDHMLFTMCSNKSESDWCLMLNKQFLQLFHGLSSYIMMMMTLDLY